ncbi:MAG: glucosamine-6-phosphate deaminase [Erysipelotrichaceae bacterium]|nr:glucosamine-6-phosphate deaminase [Erysipelotrichaceae bacterium]
MELKVLTQEEINEVVSNEIIELINNSSKCVLGLATGSTPLGVYKKLVEAYQTNEVSFENVESFNLDEYVGLDSTNNQSYRYFMDHNLFNHINIDINKTYIPSDKETSENYYKRYDDKIENHGGIDIQILGIGSNGHIAFNEPGTSFDSLTHIVSLKESTIKDNSRFFNSIDEVPTRAISMGLKSIMNAKRIILIAFGKNKQEAIRCLFEEEANENLPASILKSHPNVTIYCDKEASSLLKINA